MKILTLCSWGCVRSVGLSILLKEKYNRKDVIAAGLDNTTPETMHLLMTWADRIILVGEADHLRKIPSEFAGKLTHFDIGIDRFHGNARHPELIELLEIELGNSNIL